MILELPSRIITVAQLTLTTRGQTSICNHTHFSKWKPAEKPGHATKNKVMPFSGQYMELETIMLREISHTQKDNIICYLSYKEFGR
jgi:hypothetical protein